jgi:hypothetical protein
MSAAATLKAVSMAADLLTVTVHLTTKLQEVNALLQKARTEGRTISDEELDAVVSKDDAEKLKLDVAIAKKASEAP